ncbi:hypothetical protein [Roseicella aerolata]|uniref:Uncharacterized protein n=1 Tax=Roseicella aerolata TaxID=2883479 RepID=A0A9X1IHS9_9PROT|nr:hypothetical protein [Roseicella aerolata]MCB4824850.1 hypothetical protein [Roseicella aerolata]
MTRTPKTKKDDLGELHSVKLAEDPVTQAEAPVASAIPVDDAADLHPVKEAEVTSDSGGSQIQVNLDELPAGGGDPSALGEEPMPEMFEDIEEEGKRKPVVALR